VTTKTIIVSAAIDVSGTKYRNQALNVSESTDASIP
jgi:hypothetical protein